MLRTTRIGKPNENTRAPKPRLCPVCNEQKIAREFRQTNQNPRLSVICYQCRKDDPRCEAKFYGMSFRRIDSPFRKRFYAVRRLLKATYSKKEVKKLGKRIDEHSVQLLKFPERVAAILGKTYAVRGDDFKLSDDEALTRIRDLCDEMDDALIARNKDKRLSRIS